MIMSPTLRHGGGCLCLPPLIPARYPSHALQPEAPLQDNYKEFSVCFHSFKKKEEKKQVEKTNEAISGNATWRNILQIENSS